LLALAWGTALDGEDFAYFYHPTGRSEVYVTESAIFGQPEWPKAIAALALAA
jgi:hypothetical protein